MSSTEQAITLRFFYQKGQHFRVVHVDGAHGGISPSGKYICMSLFNDRRPIPQEQLYPVAQDGSLGTPTETKAKDGIVREIEICAVMDLNVARSLHQWLGDKVNALEKISRELRSRSEQHDK